MTGITFQVFYVFLIIYPVEAPRYDFEGQSYENRLASYQKSVRYGIKSHTIGGSDLASDFFRAFVRVKII